MNVSPAILRRALIVASTISVLVAFASCIGVAGSFIRPILDLHRLYRIATLTRTASFCFLAAYIVAGFAFPSGAAARSRPQASSWASTVLKVLCGACFLFVVLSPHTYIYPDSSGWITKSKAGVFSVSNSVAREYLWRDLRVSSSIALGVALLVINFTLRFLRPPATVAMPSDRWASGPHSR